MPSTSRMRVFQCPGGSQYAAPAWSSVVQHGRVLQVAAALVGEEPPEVPAGALLGPPRTATAITGSSWNARRGRRPSRARRPPSHGGLCEVVMGQSLPPRPTRVDWLGAPRRHLRPGRPRQGGQPGPRHRLHRGEGRRPAGGGRPAARPPRRDPGGQRRGRRHARRQRGSGPRSSTGCACPTPASSRWPPACARWRRLADPVGEVTDGWTRPNGLQVQRVRVPLGVVAIIYENRPNVTSDAFGLCLKAGNAAFLRGSSGAIRSNIAIASALREGLAKAGPAARLARARGGHPPRGRGRVHAPARVDRRADPARRPVADPVDPRERHRPLRDRRRRQLPRLRRRRGRPAHGRSTSSRTPRRSARRCATPPRPSSSTGTSPPRSSPSSSPRLEGVELVGDEATQQILGDRVAALATDEDYATEFLDLKLAVRVVDTLDAAIAHITRYGSGHSEAIVTNDLPRRRSVRAARWTPRPCSSTPPPASSTARSWASEPRSASPPRSSTPEARWASASSRPASSSSRGDGQIRT